MGVHVDEQGKRHHPCCPYAARARMESLERWRASEKIREDARDLKRNRERRLGFAAIWLVIGTLAAADEEKSRPGVHA
jgi:ribosomal protein S12 methylthiotransferase accessory factor YcaO